MVLVDKEDMRKVHRHETVVQPEWSQRWWTAPAVRGEVGCPIGNHSGLLASIEKAEALCIQGMVLVWIDAPAVVLHVTRAVQIQKHVQQQQMPVQVLQVLQSPICCGGLARWHVAHKLTKCTPIELVGHPCA